MENTAPRWLLWAGIVMLLWNLIGVAAFVSQWMMTAADIAALPQMQQDLWNTMPGWAWFAYAVAVIGGALGAGRHHHAQVVGNHRIRIQPDRYRRPV